jgi:SAM-dependent methyltransferase
MKLSIHDEPEPTAKRRRALANPLPVGSLVPVQGRVRECAELVGTAERLLDVGCSSGWLAPLVLRKGVRQYVGVDRWIVGDVPGDARIRLVEGSAFDLPFEDESFDAVCLFDVIEHLPRGSELRSLKEARRVLCSGGTLYLSTPHASLVHTLLDPAWYFGHRHYRRATIEQLLSDSKFSINRMFVAGGVIECLDHIWLLAFKHLFHRGPPRPRLITTLINGSHGRDHRLGATVFAVGTR